METVVRIVRDLNGTDRSAAEQLVGHSLRENQQLVIPVVPLDVGAAPSGAAAGEGKLSDWCNVYEGLTDAEIADIEKSIVRSHDRCSAEPTAQNTGFAVVPRER